MQSRAPINRKRAPAQSAASSSTAERLRVEYWPIERLKPYERNPRKNDKAVDRIRESIRAFGFAVPILAKSDGEVIDGHLRLKGAIAERMREVPVVPCDGWAEAQVKAFRLMVNRCVSWADWDFDALAIELGELKALEFDLSLTGFDAREIDAFTLAQNPAEDEAPPLPEVPASRLGDLWLCGPHRVLCGDATSPANVARLLADREPAKHFRLTARAREWKKTAKAHANLGSFREPSILQTRRSAPPDGCLFMDSHVLCPAVDFRLTATTGGHENSS